MEALERSVQADNVRVSGLQGEIDRIQREVQALGAVNLAALEELTASRERKAFLDAQIADLSEAIDTLEDAIRKIDRETRELLRADVRPGQRTLRPACSRACSAAARRGC